MWAFTHRKNPAWIFLRAFESFGKPIHADYQEGTKTQGFGNHQVHP
jgi:hypothetical protein